ncbi:hypothetical protein AB0I84_10455 [Streptomyces spectabilis]|uniref:hypothetical protein n=1 Tax=Streptomyces spectabilis TaxID=68270 RepID=UPI0033D277F9
MIPVQMELPIAPLRHPGPGGAGASIQDRFEMFHQLNPWILEQLKVLTADCAARGLRRIGIGMLFEVLRWQYGRATCGEPFRLNNDFRSRYVRIMVEQHPEWSSLFETRELRTP